MTLSDLQRLFWCFCKNYFKTIAYTTFNKYIKTARQCMPAFGSFLCVRTFLNNMEYRAVSVFFNMSYIAPGASTPHSQWSIPPTFVASPPNQKFTMTSHQYLLMFIVLSSHSCTRATFCQPFNKRILYCIVTSRGSVAQPHSVHACLS